MYLQQKDRMLPKEPIYAALLISQEHLLSFLLDPHSYPHHPKSVRLIQTHAAYIILVPPYVYKVKKPVNFGFLDFSTLEKRHYFSKKEVVLNRRLCPQIYLGVIPISLKGKNLTFGKGDAIVEYAIKMRKLSDRYFLKQRLKKDGVKPEDLIRLALKLHSFYTSQKPKKAIDEWGRIGRLKTSTDENFRQIESYIGRTIARPAFETIRYFTDSFYSQNAFLFGSRIKGGWIRDCHGDLHLDHIHLSPESICIFDCIEFNDRFRYTDVANDIAFLAMDLDFYGRPDLSGFFVDRMANILGDSGMLRMMDFYKCYRATVFGKVESFRSSEQEVPEHGRRASRKRAQRYFRLALQYAAVGSKPTVLVVMGHIGTGKSTLANRLAKELGWEVFSSDRIRKELFGIPLHGRSKENIRSWLYAKATKNRIYNVLFQHARKHINERKSLILDATFGRRSYRDRLRKQLGDLGVSYCFIETDASDDVVKKRLSKREQKKDEISDARLENFDTLKRLYEPPSELDLSTIIATGTEGRLDDTLMNVFKSLAQIHLLGE